MTPAIFGFSGAKLTKDERSFFKDADPAGYVLFARNCIDAEQLRSLTDDLRSIHGREKLLVAIDQEGGRVARLRPPEWGSYPSGETYHNLFQKAPISAIEAARLGAEAMAIELSYMGISVNFYPSLDVRCESGHEVIGDRALGYTAEQVAALGKAILEGLEKGGVSGCVKHMPGHGRTNTDTHHHLPVVKSTALELETDIKPFRILNQAPLGMTGHLLFDAWDKTSPATFSTHIIQDIIRKNIGFDGLLLTDDIDMEALSGTVPERSLRAYEAGCDIVLNCWAKMSDMVKIAECLPAMNKKETQRLEKALSSTFLRTDLADYSTLIAKRDDLLGQLGKVV